MFGNRRFMEVYQAGWEGGFSFRENGCKGDCPEAMDAVTPEEFMSDGYPLLQASFNQGRRHGYFAADGLYSAVRS